MAQILITTAGISRWAVVNGLWATIRHKGYIPDKVYLVSRIGNEIGGKQLAEAIDVLLRSHGKEPEVVLVKVDEKEFM